MHKNRHDACGSYHLNDLMNLNYIGFFLSNLSVFVSNYNWYLIEEINEVLVVIRSSCPKCLWNFRYNYLPTLHQSSTMYSCTSFFATFMFQNSSWSQFQIQLVNKAHYCCFSWFYVNWHFFLDAKKYRNCNFGFVYENMKNSPSQITSIILSWRVGIFQGSLCVNFY